MLLKRIGRKMLVKIKPNPWRKRRIKRFGTFFKAIEYYCTNTTLHGLRHVVDRELHPIEQILWLALFACSSAVASNVIFSLAHRFQEAPTSIGIESMNYKISGVPFPSVTLCPNDRVDWDKALDLEKQIFPNSTDHETLKTFRQILARLSMVTFGDFDQLTFLKHRRIDKLFGEVNVTDVLRKVLPSCEELLSNCWWRGTYRNCCEIFELQKTEHGFCYSFNSQLAELPEDGGERRRIEVRPRRASGYGDWSGVKVTVHTRNVTKPPDSEELDGVVLMLGDPRVWPNSGTMIPAGSLTSVSLDCVSGFATQPVLDLDKRRRPCKHVDSEVYNQETCISLCKRSYVIKHCGCNPSFLFPSNSHRDCRVKDFICLAKYNDEFSDYNILTDEQDDYDEKTMICDCPPECEYYIYVPQSTIVPTYGSYDVSMDVHFASQTSFRYKTDIVITDLDLLVSFGGIIGLFLGGSLLSAVELIYYVMVMVFFYLRSCWLSRRKNEVEDVKPTSRGECSTILALPILDYAPVKPRSKKIPILVNYATVRAAWDRY